MSPLTDAVAYAALLRNELLGAGIETVPDPHTDDRRHAVLSQDTHSLFRVSPSHRIHVCYYTLVINGGTIFMFSVSSSTQFTQRECLLTAAMKSPRIPSLPSATKGSQRFLVYSHKLLHISICVWVLVCVWCLCAVTSCYDHHESQHERSPKSPLKFWMHRSCRMTST